MPGHRTRVCATVTAGSAANAFADTASHWARGYASLLNTRGIMKGEGKGGSMYFYPDRNLTRKEFAVTMARTLGLDTSSADVSALGAGQHPVLGGRCGKRGRKGRLHDRRVARRRDVFQS